MNKEVSHLNLETQSRNGLDVSWDKGRVSKSTETDLKNKIWFDLQTENERRWVNA